MGVVLIATLAFGADHAALRTGAADGVEIRPASVSPRPLRAALPILLVFLVTICFTSFFPKWCCGCRSKESRNRSAASSRRGEGYICSAVKSIRRPCETGPITALSLGDGRCG